MTMNSQDILYSPSYWSKRFPPTKIIEEHLKYCSLESSKIRHSIPCHLNIKYGSLPREKFNIFGTDLPKGCPILVFIHGGYWSTEEIDRQTYEFVAMNLYRNQIKTIFVGYELCPNVTLEQIIMEIEKAALECINYGINNNSSGIVFCGHSAGGYLAATLFQLLTKLNHTELDIIKAIVPISGIFNLVPLQQTIVNTPLKLSPATAGKLSLNANFNQCLNAIRVHLFVGEFESSEFINQSEDYYKEMLATQTTCTFTIIKDVDHFNIIENLTGMDYALTKYLIQICMGLELN